MNIKYESKIANLLDYLEIFKKNRDSVKTELEKRFGIPMVLFQIVNNTIDLADILISTKKLGFPAKYSDNFEILYNKEIITKETKNDLQKLCDYRNVIAHEYHLLDKESIEEITSLINSVYDFISIVEKNMK